MNFLTSRVFLGTVGAILATGAVLNMANKGRLGSPAKRLANYITSGYGAGNLPE